MNNEKKENANQSEELETEAREIDKQDLQPQQKEGSQSQETPEASEMTPEMSEQKDLQLQTQKASDQAGSKPENAKPEYSKKDLNSNRDRQLESKLVINATLPETRIALLEGDEIQELHIERDSDRGIVGNIYKGKVLRVLPGMQAAFVDIGLEKAAFLYVDDVFFPDMKNPLKTSELPDPDELKRLAEGSSVGGHSEESGESRRGFHSKGGGRQGGRSSGRGSFQNKRPGQKNNNQRNNPKQRRNNQPNITSGNIPLARTPEDHARLQREYGRLMMDVGVDVDSDDLENQIKGSTPVAQEGSEKKAVEINDETIDVIETANLVEESGQTDVQDSNDDDEDKDQVTSIGAQAKPDVPDGQPQARSPKAAEPQSSGIPKVTVDLDDAEEGQQDPDDGEQDSTNLVYRPEPIMDLSAWQADEEIEVSKVQITTNAEQPLSDEAVDSQEEGQTSSTNPSSTGSEAPAANVVPSTEAAFQGSTSRGQGRSHDHNQRGRYRNHDRNSRHNRSHGGVSAKEQGERDGGQYGRDYGEDELPIRRRAESVNIADLVKEGQEILVQVVKDPIGTKGARLTCNISLPGRYLVFMPTVDHVGVSRRIESDQERRKLKELISRIKPMGTGVIVRTASGNQSDQKIKADLDFLVHSWNDIQKKFQKQKTATVVYQDLNIVLRSIRDIFSDEVDKVIVDSKREHKSIMKFVMRFIPNLKDKIILYEGDKPIFDAYNIESELSRALDRKVWLKSGGYIVIDQAEALVAIDVNTGRYVGKSTLEETILKTNLEAVEEITYQLRLRNCGGIIIIDFIDMEKESNRDKVYKALEESLKKDRARPTILKISSLGLVEMTRKRTRDTIVRSLCEPCRYCEGRGYLKNKYTVAYDIMRDIQREGPLTATQSLTIQCHPSVADVILEDKRDVLEDLERQFDKKISVTPNGAYHVEQYEMVAHREDKNIVYSSEERKQALRQRNTPSATPNDNKEGGGKSGGSRSGSRRNRGSDSRSQRGTGGSQGGSRGSSRNNQQENNQENKRDTFRKNQTSATSATQMADERASGQGITSEEADSVGVEQQNTSIPSQPLDSGSERSISTAKPVESNPSDLYEEDPNDSIGNKIDSHLTTSQGMSDLNYRGGDYRQNRGGHNRGGRSGGRNRNQRSHHNNHSGNGPRNNHRTDSGGGNRGQNQSQGMKNNRRFQSNQQNANSQGRSGGGRDNNQRRDPRGRNRFNNRNRRPFHRNDRQQNFSDGNELKRNDKDLEKNIAPTVSSSHSSHDDGNGGQE